VDADYLAEEVYNRLEDLSRGMEKAVTLRDKLGPASSPEEKARAILAAHQASARVAAALGPSRLPGVSEEFLQSWHLLEEAFETWFDRCVMWALTSDVFFLTDMEACEARLLALLETVHRLLPQLGQGD
jgi:hypothetical protein